MLESPDQLMYEGTLVSCPCTIFYDFIDDQLVSGAYLIDHVNDVMDIAAYEELVTLLTAKYGPPIDTGVTPNRQLRGPWPQTYGDFAKSVATGDVDIRSRWQLPETTITIVCTGDRDAYNAKVWVFYNSLAYEGFVQQHRLLADLDSV
jgi:hypothetical protein